MMAGNNLPIRRSVDSDKILATVATAIARVKLDNGMSTQAVAEAFGKEDRKSAVAYLAGESDPGIVGLLKATSDSRFGPAFLNNILHQVLGLNVCAAGDDQGSGLADLPVGVAAFLTAFLRAYADMKLDHQETLALAKLLRPMMPTFHGIIADADRLRA